MSLEHVVQSSILMATLNSILYETKSNWSLPIILPSVFTRWAVFCLLIERSSRNQKEWQIWNSATAPLRAIMCIILCFYFPVLLMKISGWGQCKWSFNFIRKKNKEIQKGKSGAQHLLQSL